MTETGKKWVKEITGTEWEELDLYTPDQPDYESEAELWIKAFCAEVERRSGSQKEGQVRPESLALEFYQLQQELLGETP